VPRLGRVRGGHYDLASGTTALVVAMDAEGARWGTPEKRELHRRKLQDILQSGVQGQGGALTQTELDMLVHVRTWGRYTYEFANFTDDELHTALTAVAVGNGYSVDADALRAALSHTRAGELDIRVVFDRMRWPIWKGPLAGELLPVLLGKLDHDDTQANVPVIELIYDVHDLVAHFSGGGFHLESPVARDDADGGP